MFCRMQTNPFEIDFVRIARMRNSSAASLSGGLQKSKKLQRMTKKWVIYQPENCDVLLSIRKRIFKSQVHLMNLELTVSEKCVIRFHR